MVDRIIGVLKMDVNTFEEIEADQSATTQAAIIVVVAGLASGILNGLLFSDSFIGSLFSSTLGAVLGWLAWSAITFFVGTNLFEGQADLGQMLRVMGFAWAPQILGFIPCVNVLAGLYTLVLGFIAVRQGLDLDNTKALMTVAVGFVAWLLISSILALIFGISVFGLALLSG